MIVRKWGGHKLMWVWALAATHMGLGRRLDADSALHFDETKSDSGRDPDSDRNAKSF